MTSELKLCPFCGKPAKFYRDADYFIYIECTGCCATIGTFVNKKDAAKAWNRRVFDVTEENNGWGWHYRVTEAW